MPFRTDDEQTTRQGHFHDELRKNIAHGGPPTITFIVTLSTTLALLSLRHKMVKHTLLFLLSVTGSLAFTNPARNMGIRSFATSLSVPPTKVDLSVSNFFATGKDESHSQKDVILREFEKREAEIRKRREAAQAELAKYEEKLEKLASKRDEYVAASQLAEPPTGGSFSETTLRSAVKSFCWRIVAGSVTFITTLQFSGSMSVAFKVVGADFFSKAFTMFIGERLMNKSQAGRKAGADDVGRSFAKALIWRLFAICNTLTMAIFVSKDLSIASKIASTDAVFKTALMFFYERIWARIEWGKEYLLEYAI